MFFLLEAEEDTLILEGDHFLRTLGTDEETPEAIHEAEASLYTKDHRPLHRLVVI